jgi:uncharacterized protein (TIGR00251 family)
MILSIRVVPNSKKLEIIKLSENNYKIKLDERALEGKANLRLIEVISNYLNVKKSSIKIIKGNKSRNKIVEVY